MLKNCTISFVGGGNLARALISGLRKTGFPGSQIIVSNRGREKLQALVRDFDITAAESNLAAVEKGDLLVIAVKPQDVQSVSQEIKHAVQRKAPLVISLAAALRMEALDLWLGSGLSIIRTMPNTATLIGKGITALFANARSTPAQKVIAENFFNSVGTTCWLKTEKELDLITPFIGSGIAYLYLFIEAMEEAARKTGIDPSIVQRMALQTVYSAAAMAVETGESLDQLQAQVATRGGVTEPSLAIIRKGGLFESLEEAFKIVSNRCESLGDFLGGVSVKSK